ncbi:hypothetical protein Poli38472_012365 [Pythium oligandrum]|uniref:Uncharacterized protein n=1 Tax=Pythium oligandrum TaxID=41045 RepID=A0A8K1CQ91_PYTOL|nr:hypothetical protein Poli38472_012365 [Pythium oligandrum]|eukprot:TMW67249.1 hypothetical protein Poli38472_012365 [Pythium oligandrum]
MFLATSQMSVETASDCRKRLATSELPGHAATTSESDEEGQRTETTADFGRTSSDCGEDSAIKRRRQKKKHYKPTYYVRKNEITTLQEEISDLSSQVGQLKTAKRITTPVSVHDPVFQNAILRQGLKATDLVLSGAQSVMSSHLVEEMRNPLHTPIHLTSDPTQRHRTLKALRQKKLDDTLAFLLQRVHTLDLRRTHRQGEEFDTANGDHVYTQCDVTPFRGITSVKDAYDDAVSALLYHEFSIWEKLDITTVCDDDTTVNDENISQCRFLTSTPEGIEIEKNLVVFRRFEEESERVQGPHGLIMLDSVDHDELHPYQTSTRVRMDFTHGILLTQCLRHDGDPTVSMVRWSYKRSQQPLCGIPPALNDRLMDLFAQWCAAILRVIRDQVERELDGRYDAALAIAQMHARPTGSDRTSSESEEERQPAVKRKRNYKPTYYARKDEIETLQAEIRDLTTQLQTTETDAQVRRETKTPTRQNQTLRAALQKVDLAITGAQAILLSHTANQARNPLQTYIHLPLEPSERRRVLLAIQPDVLDDGMRFIQQRMHTVNLRRPHRQTESFDDDRGDHIFIQCDVTPVRGEANTQDVYNKVLMAVHHQEFSVWERLGIKALCDAPEDPHTSASQWRFLATTNSQVEVEKNIAAFHCFVQDPSTPYGLLVQHSIENDELYPYQPSQRVRHDLSAVVLVCSAPALTPSQPPVVSIVRWSFVRLHRPHCGLSVDQEDHLVELFSHWCEAISQLAREYVQLKKTT